MRRIRILRRARQARNELGFRFSEANALVGDWIVESIAASGALRASTQMRLIVRAWRQQVTQSVERALRRLARHRELADRAYEGYVEALRHVEECLRSA